MAQLAAVPERRDGFQEEKTLAALAYPLRSRGELVFRRPNHLEKITTSPRPERLVIDGDQLTVQSGNDSPHHLDLAEHPEIGGLVDSLRATLAGNLERLQQNFHIAASGTDGSWRLALTPARPELTQLVRSIIIEGAGTRFRNVEITQANGDRQRLSIEPPP